ncbi:MAG: S1 RNA-binding domain-containing protein [Bradymonadaceae bacterium]|nr:S1 RNA-binding domain-containing protein [Lujinxingiaceae bacterium]
MSSDKKESKDQSIPPRVRKPSDKPDDAVLSGEQASEQASEKAEPAEPARLAPLVPRPAPKPAAEVAAAAARRSMPETRVARPEPKQSRASEKANASSSQGLTFGDAEATMDDFEALLNAEAANTPKRRKFDIGDVVEGTIISIGRHIFVDLGDQYEGVAARDGYLDKDGNLTIEVGESTRFFVLSKKGGIQLGKEMEGGSGLETVETAYEAGIPIKGRVMATNKGGFEIDLGGVAAFCPISQIDLAFTEDPNVHVGQSYTFRVTEVREGGRTVVVSRAALQRDERDAARQETLDKLEPGVRLEGRVTRVADFGAFVDLGGIEGLVHISQISHANVDKASDHLKEGDTVLVEVLNIEQPVGDRQMRIGLSMKAVEEDPWLSVNDRFAVGQKLEGTVVRLAPFGAFVELAPGLDGLVHVSQMSWERHVATPSDIVALGERVNVEVQDIDILRRRISLSIKGAPPAREVVEDVKPGAKPRPEVEPTSYDDAPAGRGRFGTLGDLLKARKDD